MLPLLSLSQEQCGTVEYNKMIYGQKNVLDIRNHFENWLARKIAEQKKQTLFQLEEDLETVIKIPVVIHVIHNNEELGIGSNISDAQIQSQIDVLNEDFRRRNADRVNTPANFVGVAADTQIEFVLAKRDPEGLPTSAISRVVGTKSFWNRRDHTILKSLSYWSSENYLNIWVTTLKGKWLGYAQFPISNELNGLKDLSYNAPLADGVVIDYRVFGLTDKYPTEESKKKYNKGRTATHEIGHFLGLLHIWGEHCGTDYCSDTPAQERENTGCPTHPKSNSCGTTDEMFENFMNYTNDECMNLFTMDQKVRMRTVLKNSPRRQSLTTSLALLDPIDYDNDLGIFNVSSPDIATCNSSITPSIIVKNYGNNTAINPTIRLSVNGTLQETLSPNLSITTSTTITFSEVSLVEGNSLLEFEILTVNGTSDENPLNNTKQHKIVLLPVSQANIAENFQNGIENMTIDNIDDDKTWEIVDAPNGIRGNKALYIDYHDYGNYGAEDWLTSPVMDFSDLPSARLIFDYAHAKYPERNDQLKVLLSDNCGVSYEELFNESGNSLSTVSGTRTKNFTPATIEDWQSMSIDLSSYIGNSEIQIAFVGKNDFGNNIYLDNIYLITSQEVNAKLLQINTPAIVANNAVQPLSITVKNIGGTVIRELDISYSIDSQPPKQFNTTNLDMKSGLSTQITLEEITSAQGLHNVSVTVSKINGIPDVDMSDNTLSTNYSIDSSTLGVPLRESFEKTSHWISTTRSTAPSWQPIDLGGDISRYVNSVQSDDIEEEAWLVSPVLDFSRTTSPYLLFDLSYALSNNGKEETLKVLLSKNGGSDNYPHTLYSKSGSALATYNKRQNNWFPDKNNNNHWKRVNINLSDYATSKDIRIAFQLTNRSGNNIYLDNIEFFANANLRPANIGTKKIVHFPNPIFSGSILNLTFNLEEQQKTSIKIFDLAGNQVFKQIEPYALNQTFAYDVSHLPSGIFILSITGKYFKYNARIVTIR